jgi:hypothetical protein
MNWVHKTRPRWINPISEHVIPGVDMAVYLECEVLPRTLQHLQQKRGTV